MNTRRRILGAGEEPVDPWADWVVGGFYGWQADLKNYSGVLTSPVFEIVGGRSYTIKCGTSKSTVGDNGLNQVRYYGSNMAINSYEGASHGAGVWTKAAPSGATYCRVCISKAGKESCFMRDDVTGKYLFKGANVT